LAQGKIAFKEDIVEGLENSISAFQGLLSGKNFGKLIIKVAE
ncbi:MAG: NADP-dependent oxidoreductase, partial [Enterobacterales bacterium]|nr:NADP-dependent oxidoreductase [Enterobacterales bacterium]